MATQFVPALKLKYKTRKLRRQYWADFAYVEFKNGWRERSYSCKTSSYQIRDLHKDEVKSLLEDFKEPEWEYYDEAKQRMKHGIEQSLLNIKQELTSLWALIQKL